jgi:polyisoprenoid-binding protein YceI
MKLKALPVVLLLMIILAACGGSSEVVDPQQPTDEPAPTATAAPEPTPDEPDEAAPDEAAPDQEEVQVSTQFDILPETSEVRFYIDELLRGEPKNVEGITQAVSGGVLIESLDPLTVTMQPFEIEAATFVTDSNFRNRAIADAILQASRYPTIVFTPTSITGLPQSGEPGQSYTFEVTGDLTIREITQPATFQVTLSADSDDSISGSATTTINRTDYELVIPSVPQVANVSEEVVLEFDFNASRSG